MIIYQPAGGKKTAAVKIFGGLKQIISAFLLRQKVTAFI